MAVPVGVITFPHFAHSSRLSLFPRRASASAPMHPVGGGGFMEFPYASAPIRALMAELVCTVEDRLHSQLLPCSLPPDVQRYHNPQGTAHAALLLRSALPSSPIDFMLGSWIHCRLPTGGALNITSLSSYLNYTTDAPHFLIELIQSSPTSVVLILDLPPRKDLVLHPDYLKAFYEDTELDKQRQLVHKIPESQPYFSSSLYIRSAVSPTAILVEIETGADGQERLDEILQEEVSTVAKEVLGIWLESCVHRKREIGDEEQGYLKRRDEMFKRQTIEIDLGSSLPRLFGQETADRVLGALRGVFGA